MKEIIEKAYKLFSSYRADTPLDICTECCINEEELRILLTSSIREIPQDVLMTYNNGANTGQTPVAENKYFLPRYLDLISQFKYPSHSEEITIQRLNSIKKEDWMSEELQLLEDFSLAFFSSCLSQYPMPEFSTTDSVLTMFWNAKLDIGRLLELWSNQSNKEALLHYKDLMFDGFKRNNEYELSNGFSDSKLGKVIGEWARNPAVRSHFVKLYEELLMNDVEFDSNEHVQLDVIYNGYI